jgi:peptide-methionine (S)-S-oxide reductase
MQLDRFYKAENLPDKHSALPDRINPVEINPHHYVNGNPIIAPVPAHLQQAVFGLGCFWGAERKFWQLPGVFSTAVGYAGGMTANPSYEDVCSGRTGHTEVVLVFYDPDAIDFGQLLQTFWEAHDPTQGMRQGNDRGTQYRSAVYTTSEDQARLVEQSRANYQWALCDAGYGNITTEIAPLQEFYYAEDYHQQYLAKNPAGYCGIGGTGVCMPAEQQGG